MYSIKHGSLKLFENYLKNRHQLTIINGIRSKNSLIKFGVPQGSVLGPLLFLIYINDIVNINLNGKISLYADDIAIFYSNNDSNIKTNILNDLLKIENWCENNKFYLNENKCYYLTTEQKNDNLSLKINNKEIKKVNHYKYLGLIIDKNLNFKEHINYLILKISKFTGLFKRFANCLNLHTKKLLYFSYIQSNLIYLSTIWGQANKNDIERLKRCQNKAIKSLYNFPFDISSNLIYKNTNILNINEIIYQQQNKLIHKILTNQIKTNLILTNRNDIHNYSTRSSNNLNFSKTKTTKAKKALTHNGLIQYNNLPESIKTIKNFKTFSSHLKKIIFEKRNLDIHYK